MKLETATNGGSFRDQLELRSTVFLRDFPLNLYFDRNIVESINRPLSRQSRDLLAVIQNIYSVRFIARTDLFCAPTSRIKHPESLPTISSQRYKSRRFFLNMLDFLHIIQYNTKQIEYRIQNSGDLRIYDLLIIIDYFRLLRVFS